MVKAKTNAKRTKKRSHRKAYRGKNAAEGSVRHGPKKKARRLSIADAVKIAEAQVAPEDDPYLKNATIAARALTLLLPNAGIDEDNVEFDVSFVGYNVPTPIKLVRSYLEYHELQTHMPTTKNGQRLPGERDSGFVFSDFNDELIVLPRRIAREWAEMFRALDTSETWGEVRKKLHLVCTPKQFGP
jgi:hypothetical protein